ncbi:aldolase catalytic domain-containing protein [Lacrimispora algidixylanolytica]|uniref:Pyruvate carboxyltransferase n=1 Tax=Lacrimispora algidixylanolytica TaxID=94868 RepID=A0A419TBJ3_9FIRM|nr:aldolase catalytic domain-containing protein [Lacrimispora algidixylanolytica]RKD34825.1 pyruvate carboxyltransferase [Lacrimispora algidixylanolytica]
MNSLKVLDVTLRDGGCVNDFNFGQAYMESVLCALEKSRVDIIELGYIDAEKGSEKGRTQFINDQVITQHFLRSKKAGVTYVAMMDYDKFDLDNLQQRLESSIDGIRMAFHKNNCFDIISAGKKIIDKGYKFFIQPMTIMRYSDKELIEFIEKVNQELPDATAFYIVDSFGEMRMNDMNRILNLVDHNLLSSMTIGFHSHNNLQLSYSNAVTFLQFPTNRNLILDCSIMGMGKGAGNLNTELFLEHLNLYYDKKYQITPLLEVIDKVINVIHNEMYWGYSVEYYLSSVNHCTPNYAGYFYQKHMLPVNQVAELLGMICDDKRNSFDKDYAEKLYQTYNSNKSFDDVNTIKKLQEKFINKRVVVIAPGKNVIRHIDNIEALIKEEDVVSVSLNNFKIFDTDYIFTTRKDAYNTAVNAGKMIIAPSSVTTDSMESIYVIDYKKWIVVDGETQDSSGVMIINLLKKCNVKEIFLAGFDGFSVNINENYYDITMRIPVTEKQAIMRNEFYREFLSKISKDIKITFLTESKYV